MVVGRCCRKVCVVGSRSAMKPRDPRAKRRVHRVQPIAPAPPSVAATARRFEPPPVAVDRSTVPLPIAARLSHDTRGLLAINTDALRAVLDHHAQRDAERSEGMGSKRTIAPATTSDSDDSGFASRLQLQMWLDTFVHEARVFRSASIASELLMERVQSCTRGLPHPHQITTAVVMALLFEFAPQFRTAAELGVGLVDELSQAIYVTPVRCTGLSTAVAAFGRGTYFDAFRTVEAAYYAQRDKARKFGVMQARGQRVLDRAIGTWQRSHAKRLLQRWHHLAHNHTQLRQKYKKLFSRVSSNNLAEKAIIQWRQHAHRVHVGALSRSNNKSATELHSARKAHVAADERLKAAQSEAHHHERELESLRVGIEAVKARLVVCRSNTSVAHATYIAARRSWATAVVPVFNDARRVPPDTNVVNWVKDVVSDRGVDSSTSSAKKMGPRSKLSANVMLELLEALVESSESRRKGGASLELSSSYHKAVMTTAANSNVFEVADRILKQYRLLTRGLDPPISATDIVRGDQLRLTYFASHLMELNVGGNMTYFFSNSIPTGLATPFVSKLRDDPPNGTVAKPHDLDTIMEDWRAGKQQLLAGGAYRSALVASDRAVSEIIQFGEEVHLHREVAKLFDRLNVAGAVRREHIEDCVLAAHPSRAAEISLQWPDTGVTTVNDLATYIATVAELVDSDAQKLLAHIQYDLSVTSPVAFLFHLMDEEVQLVAQAFERDLRHSFEVHTSTGWTGSGPAIFTRDAADKLVAHVLLNVTLSQPKDVFMALYDPLVQLLPARGETCMTAMLCAMAEYFDPNPYTPLHVKLRVFFRSLFRT